MCCYQFMHASLQVQFILFKRKHRCRQLMLLHVYYWFQYSYFEGVNGNFISKNEVSIIAKAFVSAWTLSKESNSILCKWCPNDDLMDGGTSKTQTYKNKYRYIIESHNN